MSQPYAVRPVDDSFFETAPLVVEVAVDLDATPEQVWAALASEEMWSWLPVLDRLRWVTPPPLGEGATRTVRVARMFEIEERFYRWEEARRATFHVVSSTRPVVDGFAEDFVLEPVGSGTRLVWKLAAAPKAAGGRDLAWLAPLLAPGNRFAIGGIKKILPR